MRAAGGLSLSMGCRFDRRRFAADISALDSSKEAVVEADGPVAADETPASAEDVRRRNRIRTSGDSVPDPCSSFEAFQSLGVPAAALKAVAERGFRRPTPVQMQAIPSLLARRDTLACAPTGSGKTLAFILPVVSLLRKHSKRGVRALVVSPTRELSVQTGRELNWAAAAGKRIPTGVDVLIRWLREGMTLNRVKFVVLDEADRLFGMGFVQQIKKIVAACPDSVRCLFSATLPEPVEGLARTVLNSPVRIMIGGRSSACANVRQKLLFCGTEVGKLQSVRRLLVEGVKPPVLVFLQNVERAEELFQALREGGYAVGVMHATLPTDVRERMCSEFRRGKLLFLLCTDLMARGIDFRRVATVVNYDMPTTAVDYIHRVGRTGRAGLIGEAVTLFTEDDRELIPAIARVIHRAGGELDEWTLNLPKVKRVRQKELEVLPPQRRSIWRGRYVPLPHRDRPRKRRRQE